MGVNPLPVEARPVPDAAPSPFRRAYLRGEERLKDLYPPRLESMNDAASLEPTTAGPVDPGLANRVIRLNRERGAGESRDDRLRLVGESGTRFVLAGQQPGLLLGPHLTLYKLLSLAALARAIGRSRGESVVPLFWIASHDADREEIDSVTVPGEQGDPRTVRFPFAPRPKRTEVGACTLSPDEWVSFLDRLRGLLPPTEFRDPLFDRLSPLVGEETGITELFVSVAHTLLPDGEIIFVDGRDAIETPAGRELLAAAVRTPRETIAALAEGGALLERAGVEPPLPVGGERLPFFLLDGDERVPLYAGDREGTVRTERGEQHGAAELAEQIEKGDVRATPSAALRPVLQDRVFPNLATLVGHSELVYHGMLGPLYDRFGVRRPPLVPRASWTILSRRSSDRLAKIGLTPEQLLAGKDGTAPGNAKGNRIDEIAGTIADLASEMVAEAERSAPGSVPSSDPARTRLAKEAGRTAERLHRFVDRAGENRRNLVHRVRNEILPGGKAQELVLSAICSLARFGPDLAGAIGERTEPDHPEPGLIIVGKGTKP